MSTMKQNMELAKDAIKYVNREDITSINVPFRVTSYHKSPLSTFDMFLFCYMRSESLESVGTVRAHYKDRKAAYEEALGRSLSSQEKTGIRQSVETQIKSNRSVRAQIGEILSSAGSQSQKRERLNALMKSTNFDANKFDLLWHKNQTDCPDESRIRSVRRAIRYKHGNCGEKSAIVATWLLENTRNTKKIFWVSAKNWDHAWVLMGEVDTFSKPLIMGTPMSRWPNDVVAADGWTGDWYPIRHHIDPIKGTFANPFQAYVRTKVQEASMAIDILEEVMWPPKFSPAFTLALAHKPAVVYARPGLRTALQHVMDNPDAMNDAIEDGTE